MSNPPNRKQGLSAPEGKAKIEDEPSLPAGKIASAVPNFVRVESYTTFVAEYAMKDGDLVMHFYRGESPAIWSNTFPGCLDQAAQEYFRATAPRLQAKYTEEVDSWWFRARGYSHVIDLKAFVGRFLDLLDEKLEASVQ